MLLFYTFSSWVLVSSLARKDTVLKNAYLSRFFLFLFVVLLIFFIPFREFKTYGEDMFLYVTTFQKMSEMSLKETFDIAIWEPLFVFMQWLISRVTSNSSIYIMTTVLIYIFILYSAIKKMFFSWQYLFIFYAYFNYAFFYSYIFNGARQGLSMMLILLAISYWLNNKGKLKFYLAGIASILFHTSALPAFLAILILKKSKIGLKKLTFIWLVFSLLFITGLNNLILKIPLVSSVGFIQVYTSAETLKHYGGEINNIKFLLFSSFFLLIAFCFYRYLDLDESFKEVYSKIIKCYLILNTYFLALGFIAFSDRIASFSWILVPILMFYPILHKKAHSPLLLFGISFAMLVIGYFSIQGFYEF